jgi:hypothetical protein
MIDHAAIRRFDVHAFRSRTPFPWEGFEAFLEPGAFRELHATFPPVERFTWHQDIPRRDGQRPHNRYYLALERGRPGGEGEKGIRLDELAPAWRALVEEIETSDTYHALIREALGVGRFELKYTWHVGVAGSEVSPHRDARVKAGTHLFYFNTRQDWRPGWGGGTVLLGQQRAETPNPDFDDFRTAVEVETLDNRSLLFRNDPDAWHGVRTLTCPPDGHRRLFNVIVEHPRDPRKRAGFWARLRAPWRTREVKGPGGARGTVM